MSRHFITTNGITTLHKRPRSEKKPIPDDQKDEKYYERRKRNNQAAKKSRDARKIREDHVRTEIKFIFKIYWKQYSFSNFDAQITDKI